MKNSTKNAVDVNNMRERIVKDKGSSSDERLESEGVQTENDNIRSGDVKGEHVASVPVPTNTESETGKHYN